MQRLFPFSKTIRADWALITAFSLALPVLAVIFSNGLQLPGTHDAYLHLIRLISAALNIKAGNLLPRWGPQLHFGFGYPLGNFYAPGWHIAGGLLVAAGLPAVPVWLFFQALGVVLYPVGGYLFARLFVNRAGALVSAAAFLYAPFRFYEIFIQGNLSQFIAMGLIAWVLWAFARCALTPNRHRVALAALLLAALIMTHHPTAAFMIPFTGLYAVLVALIVPRHRSHWQHLGAVLSALALGVGLATTYWLPALTELQYVNVQAAAEQYQLQENFVPLTDLVGAVRPPDRGSLNRPFTLNIGQVTLALAVLGGGLLIVRRRRATRWQQVHILGGLLVALGCGYMMTYPSLWLWEAIPKASLILFPWRLQGLLLVALLPAVGYVVDALPRRWHTGSATVLVGVVVFACLPLLSPIYPSVDTPPQVTPATSIEYEIASGALGGVSNNEYLPRWASQRPDFLPCASCYAQWHWQVFVNAKTLPKNVTASEAAPSQHNGSAFAITAEAPFQLELHQLYFPGWSASLDGQPVPLAITQPYGLMALAIPAGTHRVEVWYAGTPTQHLADAISLLGLAVIVALLIPIWRRRMAKVVSLPTLDYPTLGKGLAIGMAALALLVVGFIQPRTDWLQTAGTVERPLGMDKAIHRVFTDSKGTPVIELLGYTLSQKNAHYGEWLQLTLYWRAAQPLSNALAKDWTIKASLTDPVTQAVWAQSEHIAPGGFPTSRWTMDKYVIDQNTLRITSSAPPYVGDLVIEGYASDGERLNAENVTRFKLAQVRIAETGRAELPTTARRVDVAFGDVIRLRGTELTKTATRWKLRLFWEVLRTPPEDYALMLHFRAVGQEIGTADQPPIPSYVMSDWQPGQRLESVIAFDPPTMTDTLFIGLYSRATGQRLPLDNRDQTLQTADQGLFLPLEP